jgi:DNA mismatch endonuclease (patch repair protein)
MERRLKDLLTDGTFGPVPEGHSGRMKAIRARGNRSTERRARAILVRAGVSGWVLQPDGLVGKPDFLFPTARVVIFVDGCYWHGCPRCGHVPNKNRPYWSAKILGNKRRDRRHTRALRAAGYRVVRLWEHELADQDRRWLSRLRRLLADSGNGNGKVEGPPAQPG